MEETEIEFEDGWEFDLSISQISDLISGIVSQSKESGDSDLIGSIHTYIVDKLNETLENSVKNIYQIGLKFLMRC